MNDEMGKSRWVAPSNYLSSFLILTLISVLLTLFLSTYLHNPEYETIEDSEAKVIARSKQARKKLTYIIFPTKFLSSTSKFTSVTGCFEQNREDYQRRT